MHTPAKYCSSLVLKELEPEVPSPLFHLHDVTTLNKSQDPSQSRITIKEMSSSRGAFRPSALTEPSVSFSTHSALPIIKEICSPIFYNLT